MEEIPVELPQSAVHDKPPAVAADKSSTVSDVPSFVVDAGTDGNRWAYLNSYYFFLGRRGKKLDFQCVSCLPRIVDLKAVLWIRTDFVRIRILVLMFIRIPLRSRKRSE